MYPAFVHRWSQMQENNFMKGNPLDIDKGTDKSVHIIQVTL